MSDQTPARRLSLTKVQFRESVAVELLTLCQTITEDGSLSEAEVDALKDWLAENSSNDLPAIGFLSTSVERILADGKITPDECRNLHEAVEAILPPEVRKEAATHRKAVEREERDRKRAERQSTEELKREERQRARPLKIMNFMVAGVAHEGRPEVIREEVIVDDKVFLSRDRANEFSRNAVAILTRQGYHIGFAPEVEAVEMAPLLDQGCCHEAYVTKTINGRRGPIPVVQAYIFRPDANVEGAVFEAGVPAKRQMNRSSRVRQTLFLLFIFGILVLAVRAC